MKKKIMWIKVERHLKITEAYIKQEELFKDKFGTEKLRLFCERTRTS